MFNIVIIIFCNQRSGTFPRCRFSTFRSDYLTPGWLVRSFFFQCLSRSSTEANSADVQQRIAAGSRRFYNNLNNVFSSCSSSFSFLRLRMHRCRRVRQTRRQCAAATPHRHEATVVASSLNLITSQLGENYFSRTDHYHLKL